MIYYPAFLNLKNKNVLLFGAGEVALRKAKSLSETGAKLTVISKEFSPDFKRFARSKNMKLKKGSQIPGRIGEFSLVVSATSDPRFNEGVWRACTKKGILVNVVDDPAHSSFIVPSVIRRGNLQIAISTGGASPALAKALRQRFESELNQKYGDLVAYLKKQRIHIKKTILNSKDRQKYFKQFVQSKLNELESGRKK